MFLFKSSSRFMKNSGNKKVLFLALSGIGNLVMQLPTIRELKKAHPNWHITIWVAPRGTSTLAHTEPSINEVIEMPIKASVSQHIKQVLQLRKRNFDIGIVLSPGQLMKSAAYLALAGIPKRIGNTYPTKNNSHSKLFLTDTITENIHLHDIEQNLLLLTLLGIEPNPVPYYSIEVPEENTQEAARIVKSTDSLIIGMHPGSASGFEWKRWPLDRYAEVARILIQENPHARILVVGGKDEEDQKQALVDMINKDKEAAQSITAPLLTTAAVIQQCNVFISNDSGLMHIAAALRVPTLGLFGPTDEAQTGPRGKNSFTLRASDTAAVYNTEQAYSFGSTPHENMLGITVQMVIDRVHLMGVK
jgi:lipopolysaccharide heptosyltransferase II